MNIPLDEFEEIVGEVIFERGLSYFLNDYVTEFVEIAKGEYEAIVSGTDEYTVELKIENGVITEYDCDCPYDMGPVCKHIVASILYLKQKKVGFIQQSVPVQKNKKHKVVVSQLEEVLDGVTHRELKNFILERSEIDEAFSNLFLLNFMRLESGQNKDFYQGQIELALNSAMNRDGFIGWYEMSYLEDGINPIVELAQKQFENEDYRAVFYICSALLEEMVKALQFADDSSGALGRIIDTSYDMLREIASEDISEDIRVDLFNYCMSAFEKKLFSGWDWHIGMLGIASEVIKNEKEADIVIKCLDTIEGQYEQEEAQVFKLAIMRIYKGKEQVLKFIKKHIANSSIRNSEIEKAFDNKEFERAIELSKDGIACDKKDKPGLVKKWYNWLLKVAEIKKDTPKIIEYARFLFIDNFRSEKDYYKILKLKVDSNKWGDFLEELIVEISLKGRWQGTELVRKIFIKEKWWDRLFLMLKDDVSLVNIEYNEKYLSKDYAQELIQLYSESLVKYVHSNLGRKYYKIACEYLRRMKKLGGSETVDELIDKFRKIYRQRRALLDELTRV